MYAVNSMILAVEFVLNQYANLVWPMENMTTEESLVLGRETLVRLKSRLIDKTCTKYIRHILLSPLLQLLLLNI